MKKMTMVLAVALCIGCVPEREGGFTYEVACPYLFEGGVVSFCYKGHEYLTRYRGAIIHSESCPCKRR